MAAALLCSEAESSGLEGRLAALSAGINARQGEPASPHACRVLADLGIKGLDKHRAAILDVNLANESNLILVMTEEQLNIVRARFPRARVALITDLAKKGSPYIKAGSPILDPYGGSLEQYEALLLQLQPCIEGILHHMKEEFGHENNSSG